MVTTQIFSQKSCKSSRKKRFTSKSQFRYVTSHTKQPFNTCSHTKNLTYIKIFLFFYLLKPISSYFILLFNNIYVTLFQILYSVCLRRKTEHNLLSNLYIQKICFYVFYDYRMGGGKLSLNTSRNQSLRVTLSSGQPSLPY